MERNGSGHTVVVVTLVLLAAFGSDKSLPTVATLVTLPVRTDATVSVTVAEAPLLIVPKLPMIGLVFVTREPCEMVADFRITAVANVLVKRTLVAETGPILVTMIV